MALLINATVHCVSARTENSVSLANYGCGSTRLYFSTVFFIMNNGNTRPPARIIIIVKVMERIVRRQMVDVLNQHNRLSDAQHGFRSHRSTTSLLLTVVHDWALSLEHCSTTHCVFLDFAKAFDSVPHERLLAKLHALGVTGSLLLWLRGFLSSRLQRVVVNGCYSSWLPVRSGVPQGSVLGPLLFLIYVNDLHEAECHSNLKLFADDVALYKEVGSNDDCDLIQEDLNGVCSWADKWQLRLNPSKCEALAITRKRSPLVYNYYLNNTPLSWRSIVRYLGIYINSTLSWSAHCKAVAAKATKCLNFLRHTMWGATPAAKAMAYKCIIRPLMEYIVAKYGTHFLIRTSQC